MSGITLSSGHPAFWVDLPAVRSKSNYRHQRRGESWRSLRGFEADVLLRTRSVLPTGWELGDSAAPVSARPVVVAAVCAKTLLDAGNLSKSVLDAVQGVVYHSDASVRAVTEVALRTSKDQGGGVAFALLPHDATLTDIVNTVSELPGLLCAEWHPETS